MGDTQPQPQLQPRRRFYLITYPRTASNLLVRILALDKQDNVLPRKQGGYFFMPSFFLSRALGIREKTPDKWTPEDRSRLMQSYQNNFDELQQYVDQSESEGKIAFVKEHALFMLEPTAQARVLFGDASVTEPPWTVQPSHTSPSSPPTRTSLNKSLFPDEFLQTWLPTFLIRHPALSYPSFYRARRDMEGEEGAMAEGEQLNVFLTLRWTRAMYDWYALNLRATSGISGNSASWPLVLDADDIITQPDVLLQFCELVGLDPAKLQYEWKPVSAEERNTMDPRAKRMLSTLWDSVGIDKSKVSANIDIDSEAKKWKVEFGEQMGAVIEQHVRESMPDYEFLRSKRLQPRPRQTSQTSEASQTTQPSKASRASRVSFTTTCRELFFKLFPVLKRTKSSGSK